MNGRRLVALATLVAALVAAPLALAGDRSAKTVKLARRGAVVGDRFRAELATRVERLTPGAPAATKDVVATRSSYTCSILAKNPSGRFQTRLELDPEETTVEEDGRKTVTTNVARTVTLEASEDETRLIPTRGMAAATGADALAERAEATLGETWTAEKKVPLGGAILVPVRSVYRVARIDRDERGRDLVRIELTADGEGGVPATGVRIKVFGRGHVVLDAARADRPVEVKLAYRFVAEGGEGSDAETRSEVSIKTSDAPAARAPDAKESPR